MNRNFIFVFIVLAILSIAKAIPSKLRKRVTTFGACAGGYPLLNVVSVDPDPLAPGKIGKFTISDTLDAPIPKGFMLAAGFFDTSTADGKLIGSVIEAPICEPGGALACPYAAKTPFVVILSGTVPAAL